jgi:hypothetical protein
MIEIKVKIDGGYATFIIDEDADIFEIGKIIKSALKTATFSDHTINQILVPLS